MRTKWVFLSVAAVLVLGLTAGVAYGVGRQSPTQGPTTTGSQVNVSASGWQGKARSCEAMHDSPAMQRMHQRMPASLRAQCQATHEQMDQMMSGMGSMMGGSGTTDGSGMMSGDGMADQHTTSSSGR